YGPFYRPDLLVERLKGNEKALARALDKMGDLRRVLAQGLPPVIEFDGPVPKVVEGDEFILPIRIMDQGGGIGPVEYRVNGVLRQAVKTKFSKPTSRGRATHSQPIKLVPGKNEIVVIGRTKQGGITSEPLRLVLEARVPDRRPALYGLAVGIEKYRDRDMELQYAVDDVEAFVRTLEKYSRPLFTKIAIRSLTDEQATLAGIEKAFEEISDGIQAQDVFVLYLSGHGVTLDGTYHFLPRELDYTNDEALVKGSLSQERLTRLLTGVSAQKSLLILDTCHAGSFIPLPHLSKKGVAERTATSRLGHATGRAVLYASSKKQAALEGYRGHSLFTYVLLEGLKGMADLAAPGRGRDRQVTVDELAVYLEGEVRSLSRKVFGYEMVPMRDMMGHSFPITLLHKGAAP
ncbi:MAG: hypothetical protein GY859_38665, partial [Desulfobacterales bacterium]|nr:hypothetical protein [Desulfobacterales bacterium]